MADLDIKLSGPVSIIVEAVSRVAVAVIENDTKRRETMTPESRIEQDRIMAQAYWDWRRLLERVGIVEAKNG